MQFVVLNKRYSKKENIFALTVRADFQFSRERNYPIVVYLVDGSKRLGEIHSKSWYLRHNRKTQTWLLIITIEGIDNPEEVDISSIELLS